MRDHQLGVTDEMWAQALVVAMRHLYGGETCLERVYADNGIGIAPQFGLLPPAARLALHLGATLVFIPSGEPWRNGRLERFHWTMEREYFREERPSTMAPVNDHVYLPGG